MQSETETKVLSLFCETQPLNLECGKSIGPITLAYETYGKLNSDGSNAVLICHALSGDAHAAGTANYSDEIIEQIPFYRAMKQRQTGWWDGMIGPGCAFDTDKYFVICSNIIGSCYGSTGPASTNPATGSQWMADFPQVTVRDMVRAQFLLLEKLGVKNLLTISGGSLGGMQALEWAIQYPQMVRSIIPIATAARHSAWAIGFNHMARIAVTNDPNWQNGFYSEQPSQGLALARQVGMVSYRTAGSFEKRFGRERQKNSGVIFETENSFQVQSYLDYQGEKLVKRFDANSFMTITRAIDLHDVGRDRGSVKKALGMIKTPALCIGIDTDILYPADEQKQIAEGIPNGQYAEIQSPDGHDAFLIEFEQMQSVIDPFLADLQ